jgi:hypothetical protein
VTIRDVIERHGYFAHRGDPDGAGEAWEEAGFDAGEVDEWLNARCFDPDAAEDLDDVGITPEIASSKTGAGNGSYFDTVGYKVAVGDLELEKACELLGVLAAGAERPSAEARRADPASGRSRYGDVSMTRPDVLAARESKGHER